MDKGSFEYIFNSIFNSGKKTKNEILNDYVNGTLTKEEFIKQMKEVRGK